MTGSVCPVTFALNFYSWGASVAGLAFGTIPTQPAFEAYAARLRERPAYKSFKAINDEKVAHIRKG